VFNYFDLEDQAAAIAGPGLLRDTSLAIDFADQRLYVGPTIEGPQPPRTIRRPVEVYDPDPKDVHGRAASGCTAQVFRC
jgi:hypothetical protein